MRNETRTIFENYVGQIAQLNGVDAETVSKKFTVAPAVEQKIEEVIQQSSEILSKINVIPVPQQEGDKVGIGVTRPIAGRKDTSGGNRRNPGDPTDTSDRGRYRCEQTNFDWSTRYALLDAWAHKPEFQTLMRDAILKQQGRDRIMIGWNGTSVAATTNLETHPLLQDVNLGWLYKIRTHAPERVLDEGEIADGPTKAIYVHNEGTVGTDVDYRNIDAVAYDAIELLDEWHRDDTDLVVIVGRDLVHQKFLNVIQTAGDKATEMEATDRILTLPKMVGGKMAVMVPFFPANAMLITSLANLSIYAQEGTRRRTLRDEPDLDRIANYESVNESYVVEDYGRCAFVENIVMAKFVN